MLWRAWRSGVHRGKRSRRLSRKLPGRQLEVISFECTKDFPYNGVWHGKRYQTKQVVPMFKEEAPAIVVITVYVFYF